MRKSGIYAIYSPSGARYVGSALNINRRWYMHLRSLRRGDHHCAGLLRAARKYGIESLRMAVLELCEPADLLVREQVHIDATPYRQRYNSALIAGSCLGMRHTEEARRNMSQAHIGNRHSPEARAKISAYQRTKPPVTDETRAKMRAAQLGKRYAPRPPRSAEVKARMAARRSAATNTSGFHGVHFHKGAQKWMARGPGGKYLGLHLTAEAAAAAREAYLATTV